MPISDYITENSSYAHYRGNSIYYHKYGTQILGLQYKKPTASNDAPYAIKAAIYQVLRNNGVTTITDASLVHVNDFLFKIKYRTRDDVRFRAFKPDLRKFMLNASTDTYPMQSQFNNQLDRIVDSAKFGNNTYGALLRSGNQSKVEQEYCTSLAKLKDSGELYSIDDNTYYVAKNTMLVYPNNVICEVEYSKDYNKLSEIIGINSEPRFYEIPEDKSIKRNIAIDKFVVLSTEKISSGTEITYDESSLSPINQFLQMSLSGEYPNYVFTKFMGKGSNQETKSFSKEVITPCLSFASGNTLTMEWEMEDNFGAGEYQKNVSSEYAEMYANSSFFAQMLKIFNVSYTKSGDTTFTTRQSVQYCDVFGKADIMDFKYVKDGLNNDTFTKKLTMSNFIRSMPEVNGSAVYYNAISKTRFGGYAISNSYTTGQGYVIDKDARETIGINDSFHVLTNSDRIIVANNFWGKKSSDNGAVTYYYAVLWKEVSKYARDTIINNPIMSYVKATDYNLGGKLNVTKALELGLENLEHGNAIAIIYGIQDNQTYNFIVARNLEGLELEERKQDIIPYSVGSTYFKD